MAQGLIYINLMITLRIKDVQAKLLCSPITHFVVWESLIIQKLGVYAY